MLESYSLLGSGFSLLLSPLMPQLPSVVLLCLSMLLPAGGPDLRAASPAAPASTGPKVDHHQHLLSPDLAPIMAEAEEVQLKPVELPPEMAELLRRREAAWNDPVALGQLYTDQVVLAQYADQTLLLQDATLTGRAAVSDYLAKRVFARAYVLTPVGFSDSGGVRHIVVTYSRPQPRGDASDYRALASALFTVARQGDGQWRITAETLKLPGPPTYKPVDADALVKLLDEAGIERAVVLSGAYLYESARLAKLPDAAARLRAENDWTAAQVARHPTRLVGFCGVNSLADSTWAASVPIRGTMTSAGRWRREVNGT